MRHAAPFSPRMLILGGAALGLLMTAAALAWVGLVRQCAPGALFPTPPWEALTAGALAGAGFVAVQWALFRRTRFLRAEVALIDRVIDLRALRRHHIVVIALLAAVPEELLFRGALVPEVGVWLSALIFGLAHAISWQYVIYAGLAGLLCGALMVWTGGLWASIAAHATIDLLMFALLIGRRPSGGWGAGLGRKGNVEDATSGGRTMLSIPDYLATLANTLARIPEAQVEAATQLIAHAYEGDQTIFVIGNGQSATTASAFALDLTKGTAGPGRRFRVIALTDNTAALTAWANDVNYEAIFTEQLVSLFRPGDLLLAISASGNSPNVLAAAAWARAHEGKVLALTGFGGGKLSEIADAAVVVPSDDYGHVETAHIAISHYWVDYFRAWLAGRG